MFTTPALLLALNAVGLQAQPAQRILLSVARTEYKEESVFTATGSIGVPVVPRLVVGVGGTVDLNRNQTIGALDQKLGFDYGGAFMSYELAPETSVPLYFSLLAGAGRVRWTASPSAERETDWVWVFKPRIQIFLPLSDHVSLGGGTGLRFVADTDPEGLDDPDLAGWMLELSLAASW